MTHFVFSLSVPYLCPHEAPRYNISMSLGPFSASDLHWDGLSSFEWVLGGGGLISVYSISWSLLQHLGHVIDEDHVPNSLGLAQRVQAQSKYHCSRSFLFLSIWPDKNNRKSTRENVVHGVVTEMCYIYILLHIQLHSRE